MAKEKIIQIISQSSYECSVTVDCAIFGFQEHELKLLLAKRLIDPFKDYWLLPGGVMEEGQTLEEAVDNVLFNLIGITNIHSQQIKVYSNVKRHPIKRVVTVSFYALVKPENHPVIPKSHISEIEWFPINEPLPELAFDHNILVADALKTLKENLRKKLLFGELLPKYFTLKELQDLYESILDENLDRRNFRKKILQMDLLLNTGKKKQGARGGPELYKLKS